MDSWKQSFLDKLGQAQSQWVSHFDEAIKSAVDPAFLEIGEFLRSNGFKVSTPLNEQGRRSLKFELAENAYLLLIFRFTGIGEFELRQESFVPGAEPRFKKAMGRLADVKQEWAASQFRAALDEFVGLLNGSGSEQSVAEEEEPALV